MLSRPIKYAKSRVQLSSRKAVNSALLMLSRSAKSKMTWLAQFDRANSACICSVSRSTKVDQAHASRPLHHCLPFTQSLLALMWKLDTHVPESH